MLRHGRPILIAACIAFTVGSIRSAPLLAAQAAKGAESLDASRKQFRTGQYTQCLESTRKAIESRAYGEEWQILMAELLIALGRYDQAAKEIDLALLNYPVSIRLLKLGHTANQYCGGALRASEMLARIYRLGSAIEIEFWDPPDLVALGEAVLLLGCEPRLVPSPKDRSQKSEARSQKSEVCPLSSVLCPSRRGSTGDRQARLRPGCQSGSSGSAALRR
jgi:tetratricopeptide (TPR) repeat protein